ncbi:MAG: Uma2 family endonuclease [Candidatus Eremiobacterota bacterium]
MPGRQDTLLDARVIVKVLSPSTASYDRGDKFPLYRALSSLEEVLLAIERHHRGPEGEWNCSDDLELLSLHLRIPLERIYRGVES